MEDDKTKQSEMTTESVEDLELTNQQAEDTKGAGAQGRLYLGTDVGVFVG